MKKIYLPLLLLTGFSFSYGQFTPGRLVVVRIGTGAGPLTNAATATFLDEYTTTGTPGITVAMPTAVSGSNNILSNSGTATSEGALTLSQDKRYLALAGYNAAIGTSSVASTTSAAAPRVVAIVNSAGIVNTSTGLTDAYSGNNIRSAFTTNGTDIWTSGTVTGTGGTRYATIGANTSTQISSTITNTRCINVFNGQLYCTSATGAFFGVSTVGTGIPTTSGQTTTLLNGFPVASPASPYAFDMKPCTGDVIYVADDRTASPGGIQKWTLSGGTWSLTYSTILATGVGARGITVDWSGANPVIYATGTDSKIYSLTDNGSSFTGIAAIVTAATNTVLRGIAFVPTNDVTVTGSQNASGTYDNIIVNSGGILTLTGNVYVTNSLVVNNGGTLDCGNFIITGKAVSINPGATINAGNINGITASTLSGNIQTCSRTYSAGGSYAYTGGSTSQVTGNGLPSTVNNLSFINGTTALSQAVTVNGILNLSGGIATTTTSNVLTLANSASVTGGSNTSYVNGPCVWNTNATSTYTFPVGKGGAYRPVSVIPATTSAGVYMGEYFNSTPAAGLYDPKYVGIAQNEYWDVSSTSGPAAIVQLNKDNNTTWTPPGPSGTNKISVAHLVGGTWVSEDGDMQLYTYAGPLNSQPLSTFSPFTFGYGSFGVLPVNFISFNATKQSSNILLNWTTSYEQGLQKIAVQKSSDGIHFTDIKNLQPTNNANGAAYNYTYNNIAQETLLYFRIKAVQQSGKDIYTTILKISTNNKEGNMKIYPTVTNSSITVQFAAGGQGYLSVLNYEGREVMTEKVAAITLAETMNVSFLPAGLYNIKFTNASGEISTARFIKQ